MRRAKTVGISILALLAMGAVIASSATAATTKKLTLLTAKGVLAEKAEMVAKGSLEIANTAGKTECTEVTATGALVKNTEPKDDTTYSTVTFKGTEAEGACKSTNTGGAAKVTAGHTPWTGVLSGASLGSFKAEKPPEIVEEFVTSKEKCTYFARTFKSAFKAGAAGKPEAITATLTKDPIRLLKFGSGKACPELGELNGSFTFTSAGEALESEI